MAADSVLISSTEVTISGSEYQEFMLPLLRLAADGQEHTITDAIDVLADQLGVSESERDVMLSSGTQTKLYNRVTRALTYLTKSLLLEKTGRGRFKIAPRGVRGRQRDRAFEHRGERRSRSRRDRAAGQRAACSRRVVVAKFPS